MQRTRTNQIARKEEELRIQKTQTLTTYRDINTMSCPNKVDSNTIELTVHTYFYCVVDLLCVKTTKSLLFKWFCCLKGCYSDPYQVNHTCKVKL